MPPKTDTDSELKDLMLKIDKNLEVHMARTEERFNAIDRRFEEVNTRLNSLEQALIRSDNRFWALILAMFIALLGVLAKLVFFPALRV